MTIVLTTHYLDEADAMAERVVVIDHGVMIADDTGDRLKADLAGDRILLDRRRRLAPAGWSRWPTAPSSPRRSRSAGNVVNLRVVEGAGTLPGLLRALDAEGVAVESAEVRRPTLDDVFLTLTGRSLREEAAA